MSYIPLPLKYRPQRFADIVGQATIATTLSNALLCRKIANAYLFTGPRGTGKTSSARILAKSLNCLASNEPTINPCGTCEACRAITSSTSLDVIEVDAASNSGVDNIRELIERAQFAPINSRYKVFIIDECHSLSSAAMNSLLLTLEAPPKNVVFVLCTTEPQRLLSTIISRCQRFDFRRIAHSDLVEHIRHIAQLESIDITQEALHTVAQLSVGGLRDALSLLDQLSLLPGEITSDRIYELVGVMSERDLLDLLTALSANDSKALLSVTRRLLDNGLEPLSVLQGLVDGLKYLLFARTCSESSNLVKVSSATWNCLCQIAQMWSALALQQSMKVCSNAFPLLKQTTQPTLWLEATLLSLSPNITPVPETSAVSTTEVSETSPPSSKAASTAVPNTLKPRTTMRTTATLFPKTAAELPKEVANVQSDLTDTWEKTLSYLSPLNKSLLSSQGKLLNIEGDVARISMKSSNLVSIAQNRIGEISSALSQALGRPISVVIVNKCNSVCNERLI